MTQVARPLVDGDTTWMLLQVTGIAVLCFVVWGSMNQYTLSGSLQDEEAGKQMVSLYKHEELHVGSAWASMGEITPLHDVDHRKIEPLRIYKFSPKYFLTMGGWTRCSRVSGHSSS